MTDEKNETGGQFNGLRMDSLIGGPLKGACDAQSKLAESTAEFIRTVGLQNSGTGKTETAAFTFRKKVPDESGAISEKEMSLQVPLLTIVPVPPLLVRNIDVNFDMEVKMSSGEAGAGEPESESPAPRDNAMGKNDKDSASGK